MATFRKRGPYQWQTQIGSTHIGEKQQDQADLRHPAVSTVRSSLRAGKLQANTRPG